MKNLIATVSFIYCLVSHPIFAQDFGPVSGQTEKIISSHQTASSDITTEDDGGIFMTWVEIEASTFGLFGQLTAKNQLGTGAPTQITSTNASLGEGSLLNPSCAIAPNGDFLVVVWENNSTIYGRVYTQGSLTGASASFTVGSGETPSVDMASDGSFVVAYILSDQVRARRYSSIGSALGSSFGINNTPPGTGEFLSNPSLATNASGEFVVVWERGTSTNRDISGRRFDSDGTAIGTGFNITNTPGDQKSPSIAMAKTASNSPYIIAWVNNNASPAEIRAQQRTLGSGASGNFAVNTTTYGSFNATDVSMRDDGDFTVTWNTGTTNDPRYAQRYENTGTNQRMALGDEIDLPIGNSALVAVSEEADDYQVFGFTAGLNSAARLKVSAYATEEVTQAPTNIILSNNTILENNTIAQVIGSLSVDDSDGGTAYYQLYDNTSFPDNTSFQIGGTNGDELQAKQVFDFETKSAYDIQIQVIDEESRTFEKEFTIMIEDEDEVVPDNDPPTISSSNPEHNATDVPVDIPTYSITFSEDITLAQSSVGIGINRSNDAFFSSVNVTSANITDNVLTFSFPSTLEENTTYYIDIANFMIEDLAGNTFPGTDISNWSFTTESNPDSDPPVVSTLNPNDEATNVPVDQVFTIEFNEDIVPPNGTITGFIRIKNPNGSDFVSIPYNTASVTSGYLTVSGNTLSFSRTLAPDATFRVEIDDNTISDIAGNKVANLDDPNFWNFETGPPPDTQAPIVDSRNPAFNATNVPLDQEFTLTFDENIFITPNQTFISLYETGTLVEDISEDGSGYTVNGNELTFSFSGLEVNTTYSIDIENVTDEAGNEYTQNGWAFETVSSIDNTPPEIESSSPIDGQQNVSINLPGNRYLIEFNEPIRIIAEPGVAGSDYYLELRKVVGEGSTLVKSFDLEDIDDVQIANPNMELKNIPTLEYGQTYFIQYFAPGAQKPIVDLQDNPLPNYINETARTFSTESAPDDTPPTIESFSPEIGGRIANDESIVLTMSEVVKNSGLQNNQIKINERGTNNRIVTILANGTEIQYNDNVVTITHDGGFLSEDEEIEVELTWTNVPFSDLADNELDFTGEYYFTIDNEKPFATAFEYNGDDNVPVDISSLTLTMNEPIQSRSSTNILLRDSDGEVIVQHFDDLSGVAIDMNEITFDIPVTLAHNETYAVQVVTNSFEDLVGNLFSNGVGNTNGLEWSFTTEAAPDNQAPGITSVSPSNGATGVNENATFIMTFDEPVFKSPGNVTTQIVLSNGSSYSTVTAPVPSGDQITFQFPREMLYNEEFSILIPNDLYEDEAGNQLSIGSGFYLEYDWSFTTREDPSPPAVTNTTPVDNATEVSKDTELIITFSEDIQKASQNASWPIIDIYQNGTLTETILGPDVSIDGSVVTIDDHDPLTPGSNYALVVGSAALEDTNGNPFDAFEGDQTIWNFSVAKDDQVITLDPISDKLTNDAPFDIQATVDSGLPLTYTVSGPAINEDATITLTGETGTVEVTVTQEGNQQYNAASATTSFTVNDPAKTHQTITFDAIADKVYGDVFTLAASASSGLTVDFTVSEGEDLIQLSNNEVTVIGVGNVTIEASQEGNEQYNPADVVSRSFTIAKASQSITIETIEDKFITDPSFDIEASVDSELTLTFSVDGPATNEGSTITLTGETGTVTVTVTQAGNENYQQASEQVSFEVTEPEEVLSVGEDAVYISFYPNPVKDRLNIEVDKKSTIRLIHLSGQVLIKKRMRSGAIDLSNFESGVYLLEIMSENVTIREQIIKAN